jgi:hypothetical protein
MIRQVCGWVGVAGTCACVCVWACVYRADVCVTPNPPSVYSPPPSPLPSISITYKAPPHPLALNTPIFLALHRSGPVRPSRPCCVWAWTGESRLPLHHAAQLTPTAYHHGGSSGC